MVTTFAVIMGTVLALLGSLGAILVFYNWLRLSRPYAAHITTNILISVWLLSAMVGIYIGWEGH